MVKGRIARAALYFIPLAASGCATFKVSMYDADEIDAVDTWHIDFADEPGRYEQTFGTKQGQETTIVKEGYPPVDLQLRDDLFFTIRDNYRIMVARNRQDADGLILLRPLHFMRGGYKSLHIFLADEDGEILARIRVNNGNHRPIIKDNEKFAEFCGDAVVKVMANPYLQ